MKPNIAKSNRALENGEAVTQMDSDIGTPLIHSKQSENLISLSQFLLFQKQPTEVFFKKRCS